MPRDERPPYLVAKDVDQANVKPCAYCGGPLSGKVGGSLNVYRVTIENATFDRLHWRWMLLNKKTGLGLCSVCAAKTGNKATAAKGTKAGKKAKR